jgi:hypothetical protein
MWNQVQPLFNLKLYVQSENQIDETKLEHLANHLSYTTKVFGSVDTGQNVKRLYFIAPILICVCSLYGDTELLVDKDLTGTSIKSDTHFDFMLRRGTNAVCLILAETDDLEQGMVNNFIGSEEAAEVYGLDQPRGMLFASYSKWTRPQFTPGSSQEDLRHALLMCALELFAHINLPCDSYELFVTIVSPPLPSENQQTTRQ